MRTSQAILASLATLSPTHTDLQNESDRHAGHFEGKESHFKLTIVSDEFVGKTLVARHRMVYGLVHDLLTANGGTLHALAIHAYTPDEWVKQGVAPDSPNCAGKNH